MAQNPQVADCIVDEGLVVTGDEHPVDGVGDLRELLDELVGDIASVENFVTVLDGGNAAGIGAASKAPIGGYAAADEQRGAKPAIDTIDIDR